MTNTNKWEMAGTEGTYEYTVLVAGTAGRVGVRKRPGFWRVRVEPASVAAGKAMAPSFPGWKVPGQGGQDRFSTVVNSETELQAAVARAVGALTADGGIEVNPAAPAWVGKLVSETVPPQAEASAATTPAPATETREELVARVRALKLPGSNAASRWSLETLRRKLAGA